MKGVYILLVELREDDVIKTLRREFTLCKGFYIYVGSAMNNLEARIERHLSQIKKHHWHIDFLLDKARITRTFLAQTTLRKECQLASEFATVKSIDNFGCSDCHCNSHLFYSDTKNSLREVAINAFKGAGLEPVENSI